MKRPIKEQRLDELERDFRPLLLSCLRECASGRYGLFGQNDAPGVARYFQWEEAEKLKEIAIEIRDLRAEFGQPNAEVDRFLQNCSLRGSNVPGEPKLAKPLLAEILGGPAKVSDQSVS
jgi:hypothetical protein